MGWVMKCGAKSHDGTQTHSGAMINPSQLDLDAAEEIERLRTRVSDLIGALRASSGALTALLHHRPGDLDDRPEPERQAWWAAERIVRAQMETR